MIAAASTSAGSWGPPATVAGPETLPPLDVVHRVAEPTAHGSNTLDKLSETGASGDSLMFVSAARVPEDVVAMAKAGAHLRRPGMVRCSDHRCAALQIDPQRRSLWSALDRAVENQAAKIYGRGS